MELVAQCLFIGLFLASFCAGLIAHCIRRRRRSLDTTSRVHHSQGLTFLQLLTSGAFLCHLLIRLLPAADRHFVRFAAVPTTFPYTTVTAAAFFFLVYLFHELFIAVFGRRPTEEGEMENEDEMEPEEKHASLVSCRQLADVHDCSLTPPHPSIVVIMHRPPPPITPCQLLRSGLSKSLTLFIPHFSAGLLGRDHSAILPLILLLILGAIQPRSRDTPTLVLVLLVQAAFAPLGLLTAHVTPCSSPAAAFVTATLHCGCALHLVLWLARDRSARKGLLNFLAIYSGFSGDLLFIFCLDKLNLFK